MKFVSYVTLPNFNCYIEKKIVRKMTILEEHPISWFSDFYYLISSTFFEWKNSPRTEEANVTHCVFRRRSWTDSTAKRYHIRTKMLCNMTGNFSLKALVNIWKTKQIDNFYRCWWMHLILRLKQKALIMLQLIRA